MTVTVPRFRLVLLVGLVVFLVLAGTGLAQALWTASSTHTTTVAAGKIIVALDGPGLTAKNIDDDAWHAPTTVTVRNTSGVDVSISLGFSATGALDPQRVHLALWPRTGSSCPESITAAPPAATTSTLAAPALPAGTTTAKPDGAIVLCAATRVGGALAGEAGKSLTATPVVTATYAGTGWGATATGAAFTHAMASAPSPVDAASIRCDKHQNGVRLSWAPVPGATSYRIEAPETTRESHVAFVDLTRADTGRGTGNHTTVTVAALGPTGMSQPVPATVVAGNGTPACP